MAQAIIGHAKSTALRLRLILGPGQTSTPHSYAGAMGLASAMLALCIVLAPGAPKFITFQDDVPKPAITAQATNSIPEPAAPTIKIEASFHPDRPRTSTLKRPTAQSTNSGLAQKAPKPESEILAREITPDLVPESRTQYVLVMHTQVDGDGRIKTNFCVWKLTLREADNRAIRAQIVMSSL